VLPGIGPLPTLAPKRRISAALFRLSIGNRPVEGDAFVQRPADAKRLQGGNNCNRILVAEHRIMSPRSVSRNRAGPAIAVGASAIVARQHTEIISEAMREFGRPLAPLSYIVNEVSFPLNRPVNLIFGQDDPFLSAIDTTSREFLDRTRDYWQGWVRYLAAPRSSTSGDGRESRR
jgi:hypothetical protein